MTCPLLSSTAARALAALALVHRLHARDRDGVAVGDQIGAQRLRRRHQLDPWIAIAEPFERGVHREVSGTDRLELVPAKWERHRRPRADAWAVGRDDRRPTD